MFYDLNDAYSHLGEVKEAIDELKVILKIGKFDYIDKILCFIHSANMDFCKTDKVKGIPISEKFIENMKGILYNTTYIHYSHFTEEITGYSHSYCNLRIRENKKKISVVAQNLFCFNFFCFLKGIRVGSWRSRDTSISGKNPTDIPDRYKFCIHRKSGSF